MGQASSAFQFTQKRMIFNFSQCCSNSTTLSLVALLLYVTKQCFITTNCILSARNTNLILESAPFTNPSSDYLRLAKNSSSAMSSNRQPYLSVVHEGQNMNLAPGIPKGPWVNCGHLTRVNNHLHKILKSYQFLGSFPYLFPST